jgi:hypothetical protein
VSRQALKIIEVSSSKEGEYYEPDDWYDPEHKQRLYLESPLDLRLSALGGSSDQKIRYYKGKLPKKVQSRFAGYYQTKGWLRPKTAKLLASKEVQEILRIERVWYSFEDTLLMSSPEIFVADKDYVMRCFRYCVGIATWGGPDHFTKIHKQNLVYFEREGLKMESMKTQIEPLCFPGWDPLQSKMIRGPFWLIALLERGAVKHKGEVTRMAHLTDTRGFPAPSKKLQEEALVEHHQVLCQNPRPPPSPDRIVLIEMLAERIARRVDAKQLIRTLDNSEHISLTNRSSYGGPRSEGGRGFEVASLFDEWCSTCSLGGSTISPWGFSIEEEPGEPRWKSFALYPLRDEELGLDFKIDFPSDFVGTNVAGLNQNVGIQLVQMACESLLKKGILIHPDEHENDKGAYGVNDAAKTGFCRTSVKPETGGKSRIFTIQEWDRTLFLQPLGHLLIDTLATLPQCKSAMQRANTGWDWANDFRSKAHSGLQAVSFLEYQISTGDLVTATDWGDPLVGRAILDGYFRGLGLSDHPYLYTASRLLTTGVMLETGSLSKLRG